MNERNIALLKQIIIKQREICRIYIALYGEKHELTRQKLSSLGKLIYLLSRAERRCKVWRSKFHTHLAA